MIRPMMAMTTSISTSVKPCSVCRFLCGSCCRRSCRLTIPSVTSFAIAMVLASSNELRNRQQRGHDRYDQPADDGADRNDGERPDDTDDAVEAALQFRFIEFGDPAREDRQLPGLFA